MAAKKQYLYGMRDPIKVTVDSKEMEPIAQRAMRAMGKRTIAKLGCDEESHEDARTAVDGLISTYVCFRLGFRHQGISAVNSQIRILKDVCGEKAGIEVIKKAVSNVNAIIDQRFGRAVA